MQLLETSTRPPGRGGIRNNAKIICKSPESFRHPSGRGGNRNHAKMISKSVRLLHIHLAGVVTGII